MYLDVNVWHALHLNNSIEIILFTSKTGVIFVNYESRVCILHVFTESA